MDTLAHGIGVTNRFELFLDEETDPLEILRRQEEEKLKKKVEKTQIKSKPTKTTKSNVTAKKPEGPPKTVKIADTEVSNKPRPKTDRPPRNFSDSKETEKNFRNKDDQFFSSDRGGDDFRRGGRGGFRGGRGGGGRGGGGRGFFQNNNNEGRPRRTFDRHSGSDKTGVRSVEKREGAGSNNWGDMRSEIRREEGTWEEDFEAGDKPRESNNWGDDANESAKFGEGDGSPKSDGAPDAGETTDADQTTEEQVADSVKEMTLDEWKKEQEAKRAIPKYNLRKPGEGEDDKQWKKTFVLKKKLKEEESDQEEEEEEDEDINRKNQQKVELDILFHFTDSRRGNRGRGRGGRGGPRGIGGNRDNPNRDAPRDDNRPRENRGGRGGPARPKGHQAAPRVDDFNDFPSLAN